MRSVHSPHHGRPMIVGGRKKSVASAPHLSLASYLRASLPTPPAVRDYSKLAVDVLGDVMLNDRYGCCVISAGYHVTGVETANAGAAFHATSANIVTDYSAIGGFDPANPQATDNGCDLQTAIDYWRQHGFANGTKLIAGLKVDASDKATVMAGIDLFENAYLAMDLPAAYTAPFPAGPGFTWGVEGPPVPQDGHCVMACGYTADGILIDTWGLLGTLTWDAVAKYATAAGGGEFWILLTPDQLAKGQSKAPNGVDWTSLLADWDAMGGHVPLVDPPPAPAPTPTPGVPVTLEQAQQWALSGLASCWKLLSRSQAAAAVTESLAKNWPGGT